MSKRRFSRVIAIQAIYQHDIAKTSLEDLLNFSWVKKKDKHHIHQILIYSKKLIKGTLKNLDKIDSYIENYYTIKTQELTYITKSILRVSIYSLFYEKNLNPIIIMNEAILIAKRFAEDKSFTLINAILNSIIKSQNLFS